MIEGDGASDRLKCASKESGGRGYGYLRRANAKLASVAEGEGALGQAKQASAREDVINRLDMMLLALTDAAKENVCINTKCPHYSKKCKMR